MSPIQAQIIALSKAPHPRATTPPSCSSATIWASSRRPADRVAVMYAGRVAEIGPVRECGASHPNHPYTAGPHGLDPASSKSARTAPAMPLRISTAPCRASRRRFPKGCAFQSALPQSHPPFPGRAPGPHAHQQNLGRDAGLRPATRKTWTLVTSRCAAEPEGLTQPPSGEHRCPSSGRRSLASVNAECLKKTFRSLPARF